MTGRLAAGVADRVTAILPWGSLLAALARPVLPILHNVRVLCRPGAAVTMVLGVDAERDRAEAAAWRCRSWTSRTSKAR